MMTPGYMSRLKGNNRGFTIVELLVVVVVIAILATITIVTYSGMQDRARASQISASLTQAGKQLNVYKAGTGLYPTTGNLSAAGVTDSGVTFQYTSATGTTFCLTGTSKTTSLFINSTSPANATQGACPGHGANGIAPITNISVNPSFETNTSNTVGYYASPLIRDTTSAAYGTSSVSTTTNSTTNIQGIEAYIVTSGASGVTYTCSVSYRGTNGTTVQLDGRARLALGQYTGGEFSPQSLTLSNAWQRTSITFTAPVGASIAEFEFKLLSARSGITIAIDGIMCTVGNTVYNYADGNSSGWAWNGTANTSTSSGPAL